MNDEDVSSPGAVIKRISVDRDDAITPPNPDNRACVDAEWLIYRESILSHKRNVCSHRKCLLVSGWVLTLSGALSGIIRPITPAVGVCHMVGIMEGILLLVAAATWDQLCLSDVNAILVVLLLIFHSYANWMGTLLAALSNAAGNVYDATFLCLLTNDKESVNRAVAMLTNLAALFVPAAALILYGAIVSDRGPQRVATVCTVTLSLLIFSFAMCSPFLFPVVASGGAASSCPFARA